MRIVHMSLGIAVLTRAPQGGNSGEDSQLLSSLDAEKTMQVQQQTGARTLVQTR